jgi:hypothetical protein
VALHPAGTHRPSAPESIVGLDHDAGVDGADVGTPFVEVDVDVFV